METMNTLSPKMTDALIARNEEHAHSIKMSILRLEISIKSLSDRSYYADRVEKYKAEIAELLEKQSEVVAEIRRLNSTYTGWTRAFLVVNSNGHIHKNRSCQTCFDTTQYYWLTELSGDTELEIANLAGEKACTICYADAPSAIFLQKSQLEHPDVAKARAEREAKKAEREAKRLKTGIWNADGTPLKVYESSWSRYKSEIKTERTADSIAVQHYLWLSDERERDVVEMSKVQEALREIVAALAVKRGTDFDTEMGNIEMKGLKKQIAQAKANAKWVAEHPEWQR